MSDGVTNNDLRSWIEESIKNEKFINREIYIKGKLGKGSGFIGDIIFATVIGTTKDNGKKELHLVIKRSKSSDNLRKSFPVRSAFETEIHFYTKLMPGFLKLQEEHKVEDIFDAIPKCYGSVLLDNMEAIIMENLIKSGYQLHDRKKPLNLEHQRKILKEYGKFHALSFALREKKPNEFKMLTKRPNIGKEYFEDKVLRENFDTGIKDALEIFEEKKDFLLAEKLRSVLHKNGGEIILDLLTEEVSESVFTHGDCWNNNFMYKYEGNDQTSPSRIIILDWQMSGIRSPVFDLSHFIYATSTKEQLDNFEDLLGTYHNSFSTMLRQLDCDPEKLFPYSALKDHWRRYSLYGILYLPLIMKVLLCEDADAPELGDLREDETLADYTDFAIKEKDLYYERVKCALSHFFEFQFR